MARYLSYLKNLLLITIFVLLTGCTLICSKKYALIESAMQHLGVPYCLGGTSPSRGFDCSGFVRYSVAESLGIVLPRRSGDIFKVGVSVERDKLLSGDLVFFTINSHPNSHIGIYVDNERFIHASNLGCSVKIDRLDKSYWKTRYSGAKRLIQTS